MRLLDVDTLEPKEFYGDNIPPYAILSHTWDGDEITLQELQLVCGEKQSSRDEAAAQVRRKRGYHKVKSAADLASKRPLQYVWVDTCCIDKSSSADLDEAINSMYQWYKRAAVCYVFLTDVTTLEGFEKPDSELRSSRWFTRGWTLQELVAPETVVFYAKDGTFRNKSYPPRFVKALGEITGISVDVLSGSLSPSQLSVATRMKWAAHRETTRPEDQAYCLLGLFDVNLRLSYGEGATRAFLRLQEEILKTTNDQSLFAWNLTSQDADTDADTLYGLFATSPASFYQSGNMQPLPKANTHASVPADMTSQGLRIQLYLEPVSKSLPDRADPLEEDYFAILDCDILSEGRHRRPSIRLRRVSEDQYARVHLNTPVEYLDIPKQPEAAEDHSGYRTIYVHQTPVHHSLPHIQVSPANQPCCEAHNPLGIPVFSQSGSTYTLKDVFPRSRWNSHTMTMAVEYTRKPSLTAAFRFQRTRVGQGELRRCVDVIIGIQRLDVLRWEGWCFQLVSNVRKNLAAVFSEVQTKMQRITKTTYGEDITPGALCSLLGHDIPHSEVVIQDMEQQGRPWLSIQVSERLAPLDSTSPPKRPKTSTEPPITQTVTRTDSLSPEVLIPPAPPFATSDDPRKARHSVTLSLRPYSTYSSSSSSSRDSQQEGPLPTPALNTNNKQWNKPRPRANSRSRVLSSSHSSRHSDVPENPLYRAQVADSYRHSLPTPSPSPDQVERRQIRQHGHSLSQEERHVQLRDEGRGVAHAEGDASRTSYGTGHARGYSRSKSRTPPSGEETGEGEVSYRVRPVWY